MTSETIKKIATVTYTATAAGIVARFYAGEQSPETFTREHLYKTRAAAEKAGKRFIAKMNNPVEQIPAKVIKRAGKYREMITAAEKAIDNGEPGSLKLSISPANAKMGPVPSVSLMPICTCPLPAWYTCGVYCYAAAMADNTARGNIAKAYARNTAILKKRPDIYWAAVRNTIAGSRFFRFHVAGDCPNMDYIREVFRAAVDFPKCDILIFTKRFNDFNSVIHEHGGKVPENLHIMYSGGPGIEFNNPYNIPVAMFIPAGKETPEEYAACGGCCYDCGCRGCGCWNLNPGQILALNEHGNGHKRTNKGSETK